MLHDTFCSVLIIAANCSYSVYTAVNQIFIVLVVLHQSVLQLARPILASVQYSFKILGKVEVVVTLSDATILRI